MIENTKTRWQKRRRHGVHDGEVSGAFCGRAFKDTRMAMQVFCMENPTRDCKHSPAR